MSNYFRFNQDRVLRNLTLTTLVICVIAVIKNLSSIISNFISDNVLIPRYLIYYASFASSIGALFFGIIGYLCYRNLARNRFKLHTVTFLFGLVILYIINASDINWFLMQINPCQE